MQNQNEIVAGVIRALHLKAYMVHQMAIKAPYTDDRYRKEVYQAAAQYWKDGNRGGFTTRMYGTIKFGLQSAYEQGADSVGVPLEDFEQDDKDRIDKIITEEKSHVAGLLEFMDALANRPDAKLSDANSRLDMWVNRYSDVVSQAKLQFGGKKRMAWLLGDAEHCETCKQLSRIVAWAEEWDKSGIKPKDNRLECHGYNCACRMEETSRRRSPNALKRIMAAIPQ